MTQISNTSAGGDDSPYRLTMIGSNLYFIANDPSGEQRAYMYNGTTVTQLTNISPSGDAPADIFSLGSSSTAYMILAPNGLSAIYKY